jgi:hypothetical protein
MAQLPQRRMVFNNYDCLASRMKLIFSPVGTGNDILASDKSQIFTAEKTNAGDDDSVPLDNTRAAGDVVAVDAAIHSETGLTTHDTAGRDSISGDESDSSESGMASAVAMIFGKSLILVLLTQLHFQHWCLCYVHAGILLRMEQKFEHVHRDLMALKDVMRPSTDPYEECKQAVNSHIKSQMWSFLRTNILASFCKLKSNWVDLALCCISDERTKSLLLLYPYHIKGPAWRSFIVYRSRILVTARGLYLGISPAVAKAKMKYHVDFYDLSGVAVLHSVVGKIIRD